MAFFACCGAMISCSFGVGPSTLLVTPEKRTICKVPYATIMDFVPIKNIVPFSLCNSAANPTVIAATAAKLGVFTPAACVPAPVAPWTPGSPTLIIGGVNALNSTSILNCAWAGVIKIDNPGQQNSLIK